MTYDRKDPNEVLVHAQEATWEDGQRLGVKDGPFGLISCQPLKAGVALSFDTPMEAWAVGMFLMPYACSRSQYSTNAMCAVEMTYLRGFSMAVLSQHSTKP